MKKLLLPLLLVLAIVMSVGSAQAQGVVRDQERMRPDNTEKGSEPMVRVDCEVIKDRLDDRVDHYQARSDFHLLWYERVRSRMEHLIGILKEKGYETDEIDPMLLRLKEMIALSSDHHQIFMIKMQVARELVCENPEGARSAYNEANAALATFRESVANIKEFITGNLLTLIHDLKDQRPVVSAEEG